MEKHIKQILNDLYAYDPGLKAREAELVSIIREILTLRPDTKFDEAFSRQLRFRLMNSADYSETKESWLGKIINATTMKKLNYAFGVLAVVAILVASTLYVNDQNGSKISFFTPGVKITKAGEGAFGELKNVSNAGGQGGGGGAAAAPSVTDEARSNESGKMMTTPGFGGTSEIYIPVNYKYVYKGEALELTETKREVLKKQKSDAYSMQGLLNSLNLGLINLGSFGSAKLQSASFYQDGQDGYYITVDAQNGSISLSGGWPKVEPLIACLDVPAKSSELRAPCGEVPPIRPEQIPADSELISIANQFVAQHNISMEAYGQPEVRDEWRAQYERAENKSLVYLPDVVTVVYPLNLEGREVYDESGNKTGLMIGVNVRNRKVVSMYDLSLQQYQASDYEAVTDVSRIMKLVEQGGLYGYVDPSAQRTITIELGDPKVEFVKMWNYSNNTSEELLVPSLIFPVIDQSQAEPYFYRKAVVIPLVKQILDQYPGFGGPIRIMPAAEDAKAE